MAKRTGSKTAAPQTAMSDYRHAAKRKNNPPAKIAAEGVVPAIPKAQYAYNPLEAFSGTVSLPFPAGKHKRAAVKVIDPRGNEVMKVETLG